jgi:hypothetical protein
MKTVRAVTTRGSMPNVMVFRNDQNQPDCNDSLATAWRRSYTRIEHIQKSCSLDGLPMDLRRPYPFPGRRDWPFRGLECVSPAEGRLRKSRSHATVCRNVVLDRGRREGHLRAGGVSPRTAPIGSPRDHPAITRKGRLPSSPTASKSLESWMLSAAAKRKPPATCSLWFTTNCDGSPHDD